MLSTVSFAHLLLLQTLVNCRTVVLNGAGASFPNRVYERWIAGFKHHRNKHVLLSMTYQSIGSGGGKARIMGEKGPHVHFAGSDYPLTADELADNPELIQFPTMAGSVVLAYNIPNLHNLTLNMETIVGIYNGTFRRWDDPKIKELNPNIQLPETEIIVLVRSDKSGTTYAFTNCLSSYSSEWRNTYGTFSQGLDSDRKPIFWNGTFIKFFGNTNNGMTGMVVSLYNSIGYMSVADALKSEIPYAYIKKSPGNVVKADVESVQNAIMNANGSLDIANTPGSNSYPFSSFTFFMTRHSNPTDCDAMIEFVRFVEWSLSSEVSRADTENLYMVPLDFNTIDKIKNSILKTITCKGVYVWDMYLKQLQHENQEPVDNSWMIPTYGGMGVLLAAIVTLAVLFGHQQFKVHKEILNDTWKINAAKIVIDKISVEEHKKTASTKSTTPKRAKSIKDYNEFTLADQAWLEHDHVQGIYEGTVVTLSETRIHKMSLKDKRIALFMRDQVKHINVMPFLGLTLHRLNYLVIYTGMMRGTILEVISNPKYQIQKSCIIGFCKDLAEGMKFLHKKGIVHGNLRGSNCVVDMAWNLKVTGWCENKILEPRFLDTINTDTTERITDENNARKLLWTAPELIKFNRSPSQAGDVYSFGMVVQEMLTGDEPFSELDNLPSDIITAIITCSVRPKFCPNTPTYLRRLLDATWEMDPSGRPSFANICQGLKTAYPITISVLDSIIDSFEGYVEILEQRLKDIEEQKKKLKLKTKELLLKTTPPSILDKMLDDGKVLSERVQGISAMVVLIANMDEVIDRVTADGIFNTLKYFYTGLDSITDAEDMYIVERHAEKTVYANGLPTYNKEHAENLCLIALKIKSYCQTFNRQHLDNVKAEIRLKIGISSSGVLAGILTSNVPRYTAIGKCFGEAIQMAMTSEDNMIRISQTTFDEVKYTHSLSVVEVQDKEHYQLREPPDPALEIVLQDIENNELV